MQKPHFDLGVPPDEQPMHPFVPLLRACVCRCNACGLIHDSGGHTDSLGTDFQPGPGIACAC